MQPRANLIAFPHDPNEREQFETFEDRVPPFIDQEASAEQTNKHHHEVHIHWYTGCGRRHAGCDECGSFQRGERWMLFFDHRHDIERYEHLQLSRSLLDSMSSFADAGYGHQGRIVLLRDYPSTSSDGGR